MTEQGTIHIVDDDQTLQRALKRVLTKQGFTTRAYLSAEEFLDNLPDDPVGCMILDLEMPGMNGVELQRELERLDFHMPIIFLSGKATIEIAVDAVKSGAHDFLQKPARYDALQEKIVQALQLSARHKSRNQHLMRLTRREKQLMELVVAGMTNRDIAQSLGISLSTVEYHRANMMKKLQVQGLADLITLHQEL